MLILAIILAAAAPAAAQTSDTIHTNEAEPARSSPSTPSAMRKRLNETAADILTKNATADRIALFDMAWPANAQEFATVGGKAIVQITAVVNDPTELPLKRAYVHTAKGDTVLVPIAVKDSRIRQGTKLARAVGTWREDCYYLAPAALVRRSGALLVDFAQHRVGFDLVDLPLDLPDYPLPTTVPSAAQPGATAAFLTREFPEAPPIP